MERLLLKPAEVADLLRIGRSLVYGMLATGELPSIRVGRCIRVPSVLLEKWINDQQNGKDNNSGGGGVNTPPPRLGE